MAKFTCKFYLASDLERETASHSCEFSTWTIGNFASLYCEGLILHMGNHFELYNGSKNGAIWSVRNTCNTTVGSYTYLANKIKSPAVSGNIGEAVAMPALTACLNEPIREIRFQRLRARVKSPDYLMETRKNLLERLWGLKVFDSFLRYLPMEVKSKSSGGSDRGYPKTALGQLLTYWQECLDIYPDRVGYGVIARANIDKLEIRYYLFSPKTEVTVDEICQETIQSLHNNVGRLFV